MNRIKHNPSTPCDIGDTMTYQRVARTEDPPDDEQRAAAEQVVRAHGADNVPIMDGE
jgi:hypothetical protein